VGIEEGGFGGGVGPIGWGIVHPVLLRDLYTYYGDRTLLDEQYGAVVGWTRFLESKAKNHIIDSDVGDHESLGDKTQALTGTAHYHRSVRLAAEIAGILHKTGDARRYRALALRIEAAFNRRFLAEKTASYGPDGQIDETNQAFSLYLGLVPAAKRKDALDQLVAVIDKKNNGHLSTGVFGTKYLLNALSDGGRAEIAARIVGQTTFPGWGFMVENGATTLWESWRRDERVSSHNSPMFGSVGEWFYKTLAGIAPDRNSVGFDKIVLHPFVTGGLNWARGTHRSVRGRIISDWKRDGDALSWDVAVPVGATATIHVPARGAAVVREGDGPAAKATGLTFLRMQNGAAVFKAVSGQYHFASSLPNASPPP
jgi:alpha-L-rhamnosidase